MLTSNEVLEQSKNAFREWDPIWRKHSEINGKIHKEKGLSHQDLLFNGVGKALILIAMGSSLEDKIEIIKKYQNTGIDVGCVDKAFGYLIDAGIEVKYVFLADAGISYERWLEKWIDKTKNTILISNINANPKWTQNWKGDICFSVFKDNIQSEKIYSKISGCYQFIPAGSNVGNSAVIFATQILGYDEYWLVGYDFCWDTKRNYYAFNDSDKRYWMRHVIMVDNYNNFVFTSQNLLFSARWLTDFYLKMLQPARIKIYNCSDYGILQAIPTADLKYKMETFKKRELYELNDIEKNLILSRKLKRVIITDEDLFNAGIDVSGLLKLKNINNNINYIKGISIDYIEKNEIMKYYRQLIQKGV